MSAKAAIYYLMWNFSFEVTEKTQIPIRIAKSAAGFSSESGIHLELKPRI
jgi:cytochrome P450 family 9